MGNQANPSAAAGERLSQIQDLLRRMQELAQQVASGSCTPELQAELGRLRSEIERITGTPA